MGLSTQHLALSTARRGTTADAVLGVVPEGVASPWSVGEVAEVLAWANERGATVVPCGARTKLDRGAPPASCGVLLDMSGVAGVVEHAAGDMTVTVRAGTRLDDLQAVLATAGQRLAIDPPVPGTVGGLVATGDSGALRLRYGGVRDLILGVTFVRADGVVAKGGGKVVKNVAGYDLPKLLTGSLGTLGVLVEATFRLYPLPAASVTVIKDVTAREAGSLAAAIAKSPLVPVSVDFNLGPGSSVGVLAVRFQSFEGSVKLQAEHAAQIMGAEARIVSGDDDKGLWDEMGSVTDTREGDVLARLISTPLDLPGLLESAQNVTSISGADMTVRAHMGHGHALLKWHEAGTESVAAILKQLRREAETRGGNLVLWRAPAEVRAEVDVWGDAGEGIELMRRVKAQFDPKGILNPGRFVGGI